MTFVRKIFCEKIGIHYSFISKTKLIKPSFYTSAMPWRIPARLESLPANRHSRLEEPGGSFPETQGQHDSRSGEPEHQPPP